VQGFGPAHPIDPCERPSILRKHATGRVDEGTGLGHRELSGAGIELNRLDAGRLHDVGNEAHGCPWRHLEPLRIERHRHQHAPSKVDQIPRGDESRIGAVLDQHLPVSGGERLRHDLRVVP